MRTRKGIIGIVGGFIACLVLVWCSGVIEGYERTYEVRPEIRLPEQRTDAARAIDAYERLMERYITLSEKNFGGISGDLKGVNQKLDAIDRKLTGFDLRLGRIEKALGIEAPKVPIVAEKIPKSPEGGTSKPTGEAEQSRKGGKAGSGESYSF
ncbi:MAG: hypothetical protein JW720_07815 [Sedimentisphaerales bacterium]|nr:hypothetical protein [Sedimentisphaerales bacterium]